MRFATDWRAQAEHGGFYQALASGAYEKRGLNVQIVQGGPGVNVPQLLASGAVELGMGSNSFIPFNLVAEDAPVKAVAAFFQKDPQVLIAHPDPALEDHRRSQGPSLPSGRRLDHRLLGLVESQIRLHRRSGPQIHLQSRALPRRRACGAAGLSDLRALYDREVGGFKPRVFLLADEGYPSYATMVLSPNAFARDNAKALRSFIAASAEGWRDYIQGDGKAADALIRATIRR
jgi:NitT/TauT family transport system substrate-binding protein